MPHKPGHPDKNMQAFMDSLNIKNKAIRYMAEKKKLDSMFTVNKDGFPARKDTGYVGDKPIRTPDSVVVKKKKKKRGA